MNHTILNFLFRITFIIGIIFGVHLLILDYLNLPLFNDKIILAYLVNTALAIFVFMSLFLLRNKFKDQLGFIFLFGSVLKLGLFFLLFYFHYFSDGFISKTEFSAFFIPYFFTLTIEIFSLAKWLNNI